MLRTLRISRPEFAPSPESILLDARSPMVCDLTDLLTGPSVWDTTPTPPSRGNLRQYQGGAERLGLRAEQPGLSVPIVVGSALERRIAALMLLGTLDDADACPFVLWCAADGKALGYVPWIMGRQHDQVTVYDVLEHPEDLATHEDRIRAFRTVCARHGWRYEMLDALSLIRDGINQRWLSSQVEDRLPSVGALDRSPVRCAGQGTRPRARV